MTLLEDSRTSYLIRCFIFFLQKLTTAVRPIPLSRDAISRCNSILAVVPHRFFLLCDAACVAVCVVVVVVYVDVVKPPGAPPGGSWKEVRHCGVISWIVGIFLLPCICWCPCDRKEYYVAPDRSIWTMSGARANKPCCAKDPDSDDTCFPPSM